MRPKMDAVDNIKAQWQQEKPDLPLGAMELLGRLKRCSVLYQPFLDANFEQFGLTSWEFDVLATLRRAGTPYTLTPTGLFSTLMVTSGTMTNRLKSLEKKHLIERSPNPKDARNKLVSLSSEGLAKIDEALIAHVDTQERLLSTLSDTQKETLNNSLKELLTLFETLHEQNKPTNKKSATAQ